MNILSYKGYQGSFSYDPDADIFHGDVLHMNDVITFQGRSIDELKAALAESVEVYLEYCGKKGRAPEKPFSGTFNVRLKPEIHQRIAVRAAKAGVSLNKWVAKTLETAMRE
ncbi:MAG: type II toxin-antitoxin system HicB family antitoxin [Deltaproteobacteria bacterium]|jgi:predicted HicB family RNase H-like nuclease|nr:type II toxin-antitoxin system HicB family antitoxin [Deltaproteobacteria bacterium]